MSPCLQMLDDVQRKTLSSITNVRFGHNSWILATILVCWGGLGVRSVVDLAPSAFLAPSCLVRPLVASLVSPAALIGFESFPYTLRSPRVAYQFPATL